VALESWVHSDLSTRFQGRVISVDFEISLKWGELSGRAELEGKSISVVDGLLASTAMVYHLIIVTRNTSDFEFSRAQLLNPWL
jgi:predicted nucleic acid-binding protein